MLSPAKPIDEETRLATLRGLNILDTPAEERFDRLTRLAQRIFGIPTALITLIDSDRQWFKSCQGLDITGTERNISFCGHAILNEEALVIEDATLDYRFADNPLVTGPPHIRFYAGQPLKARNGSKLGSLCIMDTKPHQFSQADRDTLRDLAAIAESELDHQNTEAAQVIQLRDSEERWKYALEGAGDGVWDWNPQTDKAVLSKRLKEILGYAENEFSDVEIGSAEHIHRDDKEHVLCTLQEYLAGSLSHYDVEFRSHCKDGSWKWVQSRGKLISRDGDGNPLRMIGTYTDISDRKNRQDEILFLNASLDERVHQRTEELKEKNTQLQATRLMLEEKIKQLALTSNYNISIMESGNDCLKVLSLEGRLLEMSMPGQKIMCVTDFEKIRNADWLSFWQRPEDAEAARRALAIARAGETGSFQGLSPTMDGTQKWWEVVVSPILGIDGKVDRLLGVSRDITERKKSEALIWQQANLDTLTGLPNRRMFQDRLAQDIKRAQRSSRPMVLMLLDLDCFKEVNDSLGHAQGDVLLAETARRIAGCVRESDTVARLGGDEFAVILSEISSPKSTERIAQNIIECLAAPFELLQEVVFVSASLGITVYPDDSENLEDLIKNADLAMYAAKNTGRNRFSYFTKVLQDAAETRLRLLSDLRHALARQQLEVYYQPIVELRTGKICKAEALLRWHHPELGAISPTKFIPLAEESGLIHEIGNWVFHQAVGELKRCRELFDPQFQMSVNKSPMQLRQSDLKHASSWLSHLQAMGLPGPSLTIEITEGVLLNAETNVTETLLMYRDAGVQVALDDFGTGYSSLSYLKRFSIDFLKIDQLFVHNLQDDPDNQALCQGIIVMAHKLGLKVIAEGVETEQQRDLLAAYGCDYVQGWLYAKALPARDFEALLIAPKSLF